MAVQKISSGARKRQAEKGNHKRRTPFSRDEFVIRFIRQQHNDLWPTKEQEVRYFEMNTTKNPSNKPAKRIKPPVHDFPLLEQALASNRRGVEKLLIAASIKIKGVRRYPGWILQHTYNLKKRPIEII